MIDKILEKLNLKSIDELKPAERITWQRWATILARGDITIDDLKQFLPKELERANAELRKFNNAPQKESFYKAYASICDTLTKFIITPSQERDRLRAMLKQKYGIE